MQPLNSGAPASGNWRKASEILIELNRLQDTEQRREFVIAELRRRSFISVPGAGFAPVKRFKIITLATNYLTCSPYTAGGAVDTSTTINVAKPSAWRAAFAERTPTVGSRMGTEEVPPPYAVNDDIYAMKSATPTGVVDGSSVPVTWLAEPRRPLLNFAVRGNHWPRRRSHQASPGRGWPHVFME